MNNIPIFQYNAAVELQKNILNFLEEVIQEKKELEIKLELTNKKIEELTKKL